MKNSLKMAAQDPAEGSRKVVERELSRGKETPGTSEKEAEQARRDIQRKSREQAELPQKGSA